MRVESNKHNSEKKNESSNFKTEKSLFDSTSHQKTANTVTPPPTTGAFSKILEESRHEAAKSDAKLSDGRNETSDAKSAKSEDEKDVEQKNEERKDLRNRQRRNGEGESRGDEESNPYAKGFLALGNRGGSDPASPPARSILHVADLERIIAVLRSERIMESKQILISLKHSILEGLQIRLTLAENGNLKAEFLAANEKIKEQLKKREKELLDILKKRSAKFTQIEILLLN